MIDRFVSVRQCRSCGCTDANACFEEGISCGWSEADPSLCTFCVARMAEAAGHPFPNLASHGFVF